MARSTGCACRASIRTRASRRCSASAEHGHWLLAPARGVAAVRRAYRPGTLVLETEFETTEGAVRIIDCMPVWDERTDVVRIVEGVRGAVPMRMELIMRVRLRRRHAVGAPRRRCAARDRRTRFARAAHAGRSCEGRDFTTVAEFTVARRPARAVRADVVSVARDAPAAGRRRGGARGDRALLARVGRRTARTTGAGATPCARRSSC